MRTLHIKNYEREINIDNDIEAIIIDYLNRPLNNIPMSVNKIIVKKQENILRKDHKIPYHCNLIIHHLEINDISVFNRINEDYQDVVILKLTSCNLEIIPSVIFNFTNLQKLNLKNNKINHIPEEITKLVNLKSLNLKNNKISVIPQYITSLTNLRRLYLGNNQLETIPENIIELTKLEHLMLEKNNICKLPNCIDLLRKLENFSLFKNHKKLLGNPR